MFKPEDKICYCFNHTYQDIKEDFLKHGRSTILSSILKAKKEGTCKCEIYHPEKR